MQNDPRLLLLLIAVSAYIIKLWRDDHRAARAGRPSPRPLPGATRAPVRASAVAAAGALVLLAVESVGEHALGITAEQSRMTALFALYTLCAVFVEEIIFPRFHRHRQTRPRRALGGRGRRVVSVRRAASVFVGMDGRLAVERRRARMEFRRERLVRHRVRVRRLAVVLCDAFRAAEHGPLAPPLLRRPLRKKPRRHRHQCRAGLPWRLVVSVPPRAQNSTFTPQ